MSSVGRMPGEIKFSDKLEADNFLQDLKTVKGFTAIAGLDEVGRGPMAGPVVAACVLLPPDHGIVGIKDSKKLSAKRREIFAEQIVDKGFWGIGVCGNEDIDRINIHQATHRAAREAVTRCIFLGAPIDYLLCDGGLDLRDAVLFPAISVIKGDLWFECIGAASIVAKVYRDKQMLVYHEIWPEYGFDTNCGYGTSQHLSAIKKYGLAPVHRKSFGICRKVRRRVNK